MTYITHKNTNFRKKSSSRHRRIFVPLYLRDENDDRETGDQLKSMILVVACKREGKKRVITLFLVSNVDRQAVAAAAAAYGSFTFLYQAAGAAFCVYGSYIYASLYPASTHIGVKPSCSIVQWYISAAKGDEYRYLG